LQLLLNDNQGKLHVIGKMAFSNCQSWTKMLCVSGNLIELHS